jgi:hypothetical protein
VNYELTSDLLLDARCEFHGLLELLGTASGQLREAASDHDMGNTQGALIVVDDFLSTVTELEHALHEVTRMAARWTIWAQEAKP